MRRAERRQALVAAATRAFARGGFAATSLDDIAAEAEVARDTIYRNFDSKTDLYRAALDAALQAVQDRFTQVGAGRFGPEGIEALFAVAHENPDGFRLLFRHAAREPEFRGLVDERQAAITAAAEVGLRRLIPDLARRQWAARLMPVLVVDAIISWLDAGSPDPEHAVETVLGIQRSMIRSLRGGLPRSSPHDS